MVVVMKRGRIIKKKKGGGEGPGLGGSKENFLAWVRM